MSVQCMYEILDLPSDTLKKVLPKASVRSLARLLAAYPRAASGPFMTVLAGCMSRTTLIFLEEEMNASRLPSYFQIRQAEQEIIKLIAEEPLEHEINALTPLVPLAQAA